MRPPSRGDAALLARLRGLGADGEARLLRLLDARRAAAAVPAPARGGFDLVDDPIVLRVFELLGFASAYGLTNVFLVCKRWARLLGEVRWESIDLLPEAFGDRLGPEEFARALARIRELVRARAYHNENHCGPPAVDLGRVAEVRVATGPSARPDNEAGAADALRCRVAAGALLSTVWSCARGVLPALRSLTLDVAGLEWAARELVDVVEIASVPWAGGPILVDAFNGNLPPLSRLRILSEAQRPIRDRDEDDEEEVSWKIGRVLCAYPGLESLSLETYYWAYGLGRSIFQEEKERRTCAGSFSSRTAGEIARAIPTLRSLEMDLGRGNAALGDLAPLVALSELRLRDLECEQGPGAVGPRVHLASPDDLGRLAAGFRRLASGPAGASLRRLVVGVEDRIADVRVDAGVLRAIAELRNLESLTVALTAGGESGGDPGIDAVRALGAMPELRELDLSLVEHIAARDVVSALAEVARDAPRLEALSLSHYDGEPGPVVGTAALLEAIEGRPGLRVPLWTLGAPRRADLGPESAAALARLQRAGRLGRARLVHRVREPADLGAMDLLRGPALVDSGLRVDVEVGVCPDELWKRDIRLDVRALYDAPRPRAPGSLAFFSIE